MLNKSPFSDLIHQQALHYGSRAAILFRKPEEKEWKPISWEDFSHIVEQVSYALLELEVGIQENIGIFSSNMPEVLYSDFGAFGIRATTVPLYATNSEEQVAYIVQDASIRYLFVGEQYQYDTALMVQRKNHSLKKIIIFDERVHTDTQDTTSIYWTDFIRLARPCHTQERQKRMAEKSVDDLANILYTSGTTGLSKGVMISHRMYQDTMAAHEHLFPLTEEDVIMNFLPFTHILERSWAMLCLSIGCTLAINQDPTQILQSMQEVHPTCMCTVPRFWEKVYAGVMEKINASNPIQRKIMLEALEVGKLYHTRYRMRKIIPPMALKMKYLFYEKTVISVLLKRLGLENHNFFPTAGAAIPPAIEEFVHAVGISMIAGYGLTESTATVSCDHWYKKITIGSVGRIREGVEISFGPNQEILLKGENITKGYYNKPDATAAAIDKDGWFHTGDAGYMKEGELFLIDRIKDLFKTSNGKYIAPQMIESKLVIDRYIDQIVIIADQRKFVSALIVPNYSLLEEFAATQHIVYSDRDALCAHPSVIEFVMNRIETLQENFAHYEKIKRITLIPNPFTLKQGELTDTLKIKRPVLYEKYRVQIEKMYEE